MNDYIIDDIKKTLDCRAIVERDLGAPESSSAHGPWTFWCPFHHESTVGAFKVFHDGYKCYSCGTHGDVIDWRMSYHSESFMEALAILNGGHLPDNPPEPQEIARREQERAERTAHELERKIQEAQKALEDLRNAQTWLQYYDAMGEEARRIWEERGVPREFQDFWQVGFKQDYSLYKMDGGKWVDYWHTPTISFPVWGYDWVVNNVKHRLLNVPPQGGKYRQEKKGVPAVPFICLPDKRDGYLFLAEGELKAMVTFATMDTDKVQVAGLPSVDPNDHVLSFFKDYDPIYLCLDPDAFDHKSPGRPSPVEKVTEQLGKERVRIVELPEKIDDLITMGVLDKAGIRSAMKRARRP